MQAGGLTAATAAMAATAAAPSFISTSQLEKEAKVSISLAERKGWTDADADGRSYGWTHGPSAGRREHFKFSAQTSRRVS